MPSSLNYFLTLIHTVADPDLRDEKDLDDQELLKRAKQALAKLV